jgi:hydrogenase expression/formation protein HypC
MCLAIPGKIERIEGEFALVNFRGVKRRVGLMLLPEAKEGDWVLVHAGFAIQKIAQREAQETLRMLEEISFYGD